MTDRTEVLHQPSYRRAVGSAEPTKDDAAALVKAIAMDIGKEVVHHIETMYPDAAVWLGSSGKLSVRNKVHNEIMAAIQVTDEGQIIARLSNRKAFRRKMKKAWADIRSKSAKRTPTA